MKNQGFSLIELLIVLMIMGTLGAIAIPNMTKHMEQSHKTADNVSAILLVEGMMQGVLEGHKIRQTGSGYEKITDMGVIFAKNGEKISLTNYIPHLPSPKEKEYVYFSYRYTSSGALYIGKVHKDGSNVQVYPAVQ